MTEEIRDGALPTPGRSKARSVSDDLAYDRTHLAVERTYAAWLRTGLSVAAGGIAVARLVPEPARGSMVALALGGSFVVLGIALIAYGARQFAVATERLSKERARPPSSTSRGAYALTVMVAALLLSVLIFLWTHRGQVPEPRVEERRTGRAISAVAHAAHAPNRRVTGRPRAGPLGKGVRSLASLEDLVGAHELRAHE